MKAHELELNTVYYSDQLEAPLLYTGEESHYGIHGEGFNRVDGSEIFIHSSQVENLRLRPWAAEWTVEEILEREG